MDDLDPGGEPLWAGYAAFGEVWGQRPNPPAITVAYVAGLAIPGAVVEIEAIAALAASPRTAKTDSRTKAGKVGSGVIRFSAVLA